MKDVNGLDLLETIVNEEQLNEIKMIRNSIFDRLDYAKYHYQEYKKTSDVKDVNAFIRAVVLDDENKRKRTAEKANITACVHNIHVIYDYLGNLIYKTLDLEINCNIYFSTVMYNIKSGNNKDFKKLLEILNNFVTAKESYYKYIHDMSNFTKHNYNIAPDAKTNNKSGEFKRELYFIEFIKDNTTHEQVIVDDILNSGYESVVQLMKEIGNELYAILQKKH